MTDPVLPDSVLPDADYLVLASRLIPDRDGGFTISVLRRAQDMAAAGARVTLLTVDPGERADHDRDRAEWVRRGLLTDPDDLRNLFDDARADAGWLRAAALPLPAPAPDEDAHGTVTGARVIADAAGRTVLELPVISGDPAWHLSSAPVTVWSEDGAAPVGWLPGFGGLYRAWVNARAAASARPVAVLCEARQVGELLVADAPPLLDPAIRVLHTTHACHLQAPYTWDAPMDAAWSRWLDIADRFDGVLWLTPSQQRDVERRVGDGIRSFVVPHPAPSGLANDPVAGRIVMLNTLSARKRVDHAIRALATVRASVPHAELHVYGDGPERAALQSLADELGVADAVVLHGHTADPEAAWATADLFALTSTNEGQPLVVLEALGHGVPVVSYDMPYGPRDTLARGGGMLVPDGDVDALAGALTALLTGPGVRAWLSDAARAAAAQMDAASSMRALAVAARAALDAPASRPGRPPHR
ncbi:glycosyltransferase [Microbacterium sp. zg.Y1090]|uniref:glycosyltransferase n=1 Tax=Microbacterium wangruii TaxID=3049073 RepID=UPI00214C5889|nr:MULTISPECIES: glycosyltransferase [unclassified Microbacterium]MCR2817914.1 glycosyltransferase [Microbacterium sp. zg.Y1090]MDL5487768.1 glycosyltransferase [Microbacterium sp. zg-Y1211]WIM27921.1 glycosyltransferase [Microbacterium sp. zg-Y1090]